MQLDEAGVEILHIFIFAAPVLAKWHNIADKLIRGYDSYLNIRLCRLGYGGGVGVVVGVIHANKRAVRFGDVIDDRGQRCYQVKVKFAL